MSLPTLPAGPLYRVTAARKVTDCYPGSLAWDVDNISLVRRVLLVKSIPTSAYTQLNSCISVRQSVTLSKKVGKLSFVLTF